MQEDITQIGLVVGIVMALIELIKYIVNKFVSQKTTTDDDDQHQLMVKELQLMNSNHLNHIENAINIGNDKIVQAIQAMHIDLVKELNRKS